MNTALHFPTTAEQHRILFPPNLHLFFNILKIMRCRGAISIRLTRFELTIWCFGPLTAVGDGFTTICASHVCAKLRLKRWVSGYRSRPNEFTCIKKGGSCFRLWTYLMCNKRKSSPADATECEARWGMGVGWWS